MVVARKMGVEFASKFVVVIIVVVCYSCYCVHYTKFTGWLWQGRWGLNLPQSMSLLLLLLLLFVILVIVFIVQNLLCGCGKEDGG